jgi:hypothetical protein
MGAELIITPVATTAMFVSRRRLSGKRHLRAQLQSAFDLLAPTRQALVAYGSQRRAKVVVISRRKVRAVVFDALPIQSTVTALPNCSAAGAEQPFLVVDPTRRIRSEATKLTGVALHRAVAPGTHRLHQEFPLP